MDTGDASYGFWLMISTNFAVTVALSIGLKWRAGSTEKALTRLFQRSYESQHKLDLAVSLNCA